MGAKIKDVFSELKKVTWPSFGTVLKNLGSVLAFVVIMLALVLVIDFGLQQGLKLIRSDSTAAAIEFIGEIL
ncbi:MAG: preprotein translocase subunit SecE [Clostridia bacterium]|nr:preprotein translocase subunit SecE [Clostridia bacterium]